MIDPTHYVALITERKELEVSEGFVALAQRRVLEVVGVRTELSAIVRQEFLTECRTLLLSHCEISAQCMPAVHGVLSTWDVVSKVQRIPEHWVRV